MRIGVLGAGWWAEEHAQAIATVPGLEVAAVCSGSLESAREYAARFGGRAVVDVQSVFPDVDVVLVTAPHEFHKALALQIIQAGKPLLLEKPVAVNWADTQEIMNSAKAAGVPCLIGFTNHYFPTFRRAKELLESGELGEPLAGHSVMQKFWMEHNRRDWHLNRQRGGGMLLTAGIHALDRLMWLMQADVQSVSAVVGTRWHQQQADDLATLFLRLAGGKSGTVGSYGYAQGGPQNSTHLLCERGALRMDVLTLEVGRDDRWESVPLALPENVVTSALAEEWCDFRRWVEQGSAPQVTPEFAGQVMQVVFAAEQSSAEGREIRLA